MEISVNDICIIIDWERGYGWPVPKEVIGATCLIIEEQFGKTYDVLIDNNDRRYGLKSWQLYNTGLTA